MGNRISLADQITQCTPFSGGSSGWLDERWTYDTCGDVLTHGYERWTKTVNGVATPKTETYTYGAPRASTQSGTFDTRQRYVGQLGHQTDPETGELIYMQARYYDPTKGGVVSEDPGRHGGNWLTYCEDDPVNGSDPSGCATEPALQWMAQFGAWAIGNLFFVLSIGALEDNLKLAQGFAALSVIFYTVAFIDLPKPTWCTLLAAAAAAVRALPAICMMMKSAEVARFGAGSGVASVAVWASVGYSLAVLGALDSVDSE
jgi:RHS repeat-associated protein